MQPYFFFIPYVSYFLTLGISTASLLFIHYRWEHFHRGLYLKNKKPRAILFFKSHFAYENWNRIYIFNPASYQTFSVSSAYHSLNVAQSTLLLQIIYFFFFFNQNYVVRNEKFDPVWFEKSYDSFIWNKVVVTTSERTSSYMKFLQLIYTTVWSSRGNLDDIK